MRHGHLGGTPPSVSPSRRKLSQSEPRFLRKDIQTDEQTVEPIGRRGPEIERARSDVSSSAGPSTPETLLEPPGRSDPDPFPIGERTASFRARHFPDVPDSKWNDWQWQLRGRFRDLAGLERILELAPAELEAIEGIGGRLPVGITPYYASLMHRTDPLEPIRRTMIPVGSEFVRGYGEAEDPLGEDSDSPVPGLVHRYPDRVLFLVTNFCATYCRYCTRARVVGHTGEFHFNQAQHQAAIDYIAAHPEIRDVLISGGDPLTLGDARLDWLLGSLKAIPHVEFVRIGTKVPAVLPMRITSALTTILKRHKPIWMSIHFQHPDEITPEVAEACGRLADAGVPLGSQTVLLKGVNDDLEVMRRLVHGLLRIRVRPYYLYQCDPISGSEHLRTPVSKGLEIIAGLRGHTTGYAAPTFVIDGPGGAGKIAIAPDTIVGRDGKDLLLRNYAGEIARYPDVVEDPGVPSREETADGAGSNADFALPSVPPRLRVTVPEVLDVGAPAVVPVAS